MGGKCVIEFIENFMWLVGGVIYTHYNDMTKR